uniref:Receptor-like serine/threonine-protein kinase n=2 Tax=Brassica napus TaxID=3708 RepID=Q7DMS5_BRANA|nr:serine/threonine kinase receptor [Brassica napus var. napus]CAB89179.1 S-locus receptor kinase [Brassica napus var. napus]
MKGVRKTYDSSYTLSFLLVFFVMFLFHPALSIHINTLSSTESLTISNNRTLVSPGNVFELGFFRTTSSSRWYLGIWYKNLPYKTYVWVANRDNPLSDSIGTLKISNMNLVLLDHSNKSVWSTNLTRGNERSPVVAELLENGNFVIRYSNNNNASGFLWQSFDFPTDTLLPEMKLGYDRKKGLNRFLTAWRNSDDPSSGEISYQLDTQRGMPEFYLLKNGVRGYRSGPWNGVRFNGIPEDQKLSYMVYNFTDNSEEAAYTFRMTDKSIYSRLIISNDEYLARLTFTPTSWEWNLFWTSPEEPECDVYKTCGSYAYCDVNTSPVCNCIQGFKPFNMQQWELRVWAGGCIRRTRLSCNGDGFTRMKNMKLPETTMAIVDRSIGRKECKKRCLSDCNCTAFANADIRNGGSGCVIWTGELEDIRNYFDDGQDLYVRLAAADLVKKRNANGKTIALIVGVCVLLLMIMFCLWKRKQKRAKTTATSIVNRQRNQDLLMNGMILSSKRQLPIENKTEELELPLIELEAVVKATENFSNCNKLGQGGFGIVYKGRLLDGQEIAVKRLSKTSVQGTGEFMNEVRLIARLQHINLVRILGCCIEADEKMLVYEYLENLSLDSYLFGNKRSSTLNWKDRFNITNGVARGLLYLHQDSRFRIIHRDMKVSNILLDKNMTPKISDFGMARIFARDETEANTRKVVGTYGYMSPEYAMDGVFSEKSDVFSFGVIVLEIVSGKRNRGFYNLNHENNLLSYVWSHWTEGRALEIVDPVIVDSLSSLPATFQPKEVLKCIQIGLLCVQERAEHRPTMSSVVWMLGSEATEIPQPTPPGYSLGRSPYENNPSSSRHCDDDESWTVNQYTCSDIDAR